uniref:Putative ribonuclease H-like domain-containing protein n=1 Tax=Tanacetum cinerariifolium TaxID=118510 RepID=A0A699HEU1_TANCI|nr:putative ribonuclease H-like domain-containing protein [Tanacetum cinerariifolium]
MSYLTDYKEIDGRYVAFGGNPKGGKISGKGTIKTGNLDFENVYFMRELRFNLFSISQMCDKNNSVLFNDTECIVLSLNFKLIDERQVLLRVPRKNNMYSVDLKNIVPKGGLTFFFSKSISNESELWHRRLGHLNFKTMNKLVKGNIVRGLPSKLFKNDQTCVACQKEKQHRPSCKPKIENSVSLPLHLLHMDLFGLTFIKSIIKKMYCIVVTDDYSRFTWVFFLAIKDESSGILKSFITGIENLVDHKVKVIRCDNGTEFKNKEMNQFYKIKGILRQFSVARTRQQNEVTKRRNMTLIEAARTMLADSKLPTNFWVEAINIACYVQNGVLVVKPHNKTPYELFHGRTPTLIFMRPFECHVTILNTMDHLGKFNGKADEGFFVGYSLNSKAFRLFNNRTRIVEENLRIRFSESTSDVVGCGPYWLFDIDALTRTMNYEPIVTGTQSNGFADPKSSHDEGSKPTSDDGNKVDEDLRKENECNDQEKEDNVSSTNNVNTVSSTVNAGGTNKDNELPFDPNMPALEDVSIFNFLSDDEDDGTVADMNNLDTTIQGLQVKQKKDVIFISQDKHVAEILKKFRFTDVKTTSTSIETQKPLLKDEDGKEVDVHMYRYQVNLKVSHLHAVKRIFRKPKRKDTQVPQPSGPTNNLVDDFVHKELGDSLVRAVTTASSLEVEQDSGAKKPLGILLLKLGLRVYLNILMIHYSQVVLYLEKTKTTQCNEIDSLKRKVKKLEKRNKARTHKMKRLYKVCLSAKVESSRDEESLGKDASKQERRINDIDADEDITPLNDADNEMFNVDMLGGEEMFVTWKNKNVVKEIVDASQVKGIVFQEPCKSSTTTTTTTTISSQQSQDKGKGIMIEEPMKSKKKDQIRLDEEAALKLHAEFDEEERLARERAEKEQDANIAWIET